MLVEYETKRCLWCNKKGTVTMTAEQAAALREPGRAHIQRLFASHSLEEREQLISGTHPECWDKLVQP